MSVHQVVLGGLRLISGDSALALTFSRPARASLALRPARLLARPKADVCPRSFDGSVTFPISRVATKAYRHLLGPDSHRLRGLTFHGTLSTIATNDAPPEDTLFGLAHCHLQLQSNT